MYDKARALSLLRTGAGRPDAEFRDGQEEAIRHIVQGEGRLLVVQKTGWGKSFVYFIAARLLRERGLGPALLVSPLLSLMRNQIEAAERMGVRAVTIHSDNVEDWVGIEARIAADDIDILLISPERLSNERFQAAVLGRIAGRIAMLVDPAGIEPPNLAPLPTRVDPATVRAAIAFLRRTSLPIDPRKQWPAGGLPNYGLRGKIAADRQAQPGKSLSVWGDAGWGSLVRSGKYQDGRFADELVEACRNMLVEWDPQPRPEWVTCIPSLRHPDLVPDFASRLAAALGLPFAPVLSKVDDRPEQKSMANSVKQARNLDGSLGIDVAAVRPGAVLLVDDMVDSKWTLTVASWLLQEAGSGPVFPLALSQTGGGE